MHSANCQNCGEEVKGNYCAHCGQKASTHRFSTRHILEHDFIHGVFHLDRGFLYTAKQLLTRPGYAIREYVEGKRVNHFNYITLILLLIAAQIFIVKSTGYDISTSLSSRLNNTTASGANISETQNALRGLQSKLLAHMKEMYMLTIPITAAVTYFMFRRAKQNYAEHLVLNSYLTAGLLMIHLFFNMLLVFAKLTPVAIIVTVMSPIATYLYAVTFYRQYFKNDYSGKIGLYIRSILGHLLPMLILGATIGLIMYIFSPTTVINWMVEGSKQSGVH